MKPLGSKLVIKGFHVSPGKGRLEGCVILQWRQVTSHKEVSRGQFGAASNFPPKKVSGLPKGSNKCIMTGKEEEEPFPELKLTPLSGKRYAR